MPHSWKVLTVSAAAIPRLAAHYQSEREEHGEDDPFFQQQLEGRFADAEEGDSVFDYESVRRAAERGRIALAAEEPSPWDRMLFGAPTWRRVLGLDPAGRGTDHSIAALRVGPNVEAIYDLGSGGDEMQTIGKAVRLIEHLRAEVVCVDVGGLGAVVESRLREVFSGPFRRPVEVESFNSSWRAADPERYSSAKAEVAFRLRERFRSGRITIPPDEKLISQLCSYSWSIDSKGRMHLLDPSPSPDRGDATILAFAADLYGPSVKTVKARGL